jgi:hypothetical protein
MSLEDYIKQQEEKAKASYKAGKENVKEAWNKTKDNARDATDNR